MFLKTKPYTDTLINSMNRHVQNILLKQMLVIHNTTLIACSFFDDYRCDAKQDNKISMKKRNSLAELFNENYLIVDNLDMKHYVCALMMIHYSIQKIVLVDDNVSLYVNN